MHISWKFKAGQHQLSNTEAQSLLKLGRGTHFIQGIGLVELDVDQRDELAQWRIHQRQQKNTSIKWPRYMIFSLFSKSRDSIRAEFCHQDLASAVSQQVIRGHDATPCIPARLPSRGDSLDGPSTRSRLPWTFGR